MCGRKSYSLVTHLFKLTQTSQSLQSAALAALGPIILLCNNAFLHPLQRHVQGVCLHAKLPNATDTGCGIIYCHVHKNLCYVSVFKYTVRFIVYDNDLLAICYPILICQLV